jgi:hypothetical protein
MLAKPTDVLPALTRRSFLGNAGCFLFAAPILSFVGTPSCVSRSSRTGVSPGGGGYTGSDDQLLDDIERAAFQFFWEQSHPLTGLTKDRAGFHGSDHYTVCSIASTGFALSGLCIADQRSYLDSASLQQRVLATLQTILNTVQGNQGFFYHFVDWSTGKRAFNCEVSSIDSALLLCGVLTARQHFSANAQIVSLATQIYNRVNWPWMLNGATALSMGWLPESGFLAARWSHYCELMMIYLLGIGSPTYPLSPGTWKAWTRPSYTYQGITYISAGDPLFSHQYSHAWFDFRNKHDDFADYFQNSVKATQAHKLFCLSLRNQFSDYGDALWGVTASDSAKGYLAWGGPPAMGRIDGSVVPCAAGGSIPFDYAGCMKVLRNMRGNYSQGWGKYGFTDAFNPLTNWWNPDVLGIDQGIMMLMAENQRSGFVWNAFMANPEALAAMQLAGFKANS